MRFTLSFVTLGLAAVEFAHALPRGYQQPSRRDAVNVLDDVLVFDAPAFDDPANPGNTLVQLQAYVSTRQLNLGILSGLGSLLNKTLGLDIGDDIDKVTSRLALLATLGLNGKAVTVDVNGCGDKATLQNTEDGGMAIQNLTLGACTENSLTALGNVELTGVADSRKVNFTVFPSSADGFGIISGGC
jgi:hypothetical protein